MPVCVDCKRERPILWSIDRPDRRSGGRMLTESVALCADCFNREAERQGRPDRVKEPTI